MGKVWSALTRALALCLAAGMLLSIGAFAAEPGGREGREGRQEDLDFLYEKVLAGTHPNLFSKTPESAFLEAKKEIEGRLETESELAFALDLMHLTALAGDSHTTLGGSQELMAQMRAYPMSLTWRDGKWYLAAAPGEEASLLGQEVTALGGRAVDEAVSAFGRILSADNPVKLRRQFRQSCMIADFWEYLDLVKPGQPLTLRFSGGKTLSLDPMPMAELESAETAQLGDRITARPATAEEDVRYLSKPLSASVYYIQYNACQEDPERPMETFAAQVEQDLDSGKYTRILLDLRNNGGGSDGVIWPLLEVLRRAMDRGTELVGLIGETTFSSAVINAVELQEMGAVLVGEAASGSVSHFGAVKSGQLPNSQYRVGVSSKWIDLNTLLDAAAGRGVEALEPDVEVNRTLADTLAGRDTAVEWLSRHPEPLEQRVYPDAPLTRGRLLGLLYEALGRPAVREAEALPFTDCFGIEWYLPALRWGKESGVAKGFGDGSFRASQPVTWQEAAVFLDRAALVRGGERRAVRSEPLPGELAGGWSQRAADWAWSRGLLPADADWTKTPVRSQGAQLVSGLA